MNQLLKYRPNVVREPIVLIVAIVAAVVLAGSFLLNKSTKITSSQIYAAEEAYAAALVVADGYKVACVGSATKAPVLVYSTCKPVVDKIRAAKKKTDAAYYAVKPYEKNPPQDLGSAFISAVVVFKAVVPQTY